MEKTTEQKLVFNAPVGTKIIKTQMKTSRDGKSVEFIITTEDQTVTVNTENFDEVFPIIDPSELIGHKLLNYEPKNEREDRLLADICKGIEMKLPAFRAPCIDPSEENGKIVFKPGNKPAVGHDADWWKETWKNFMPNKNSRIGTNLHWAAFMGKLMAYLIEKEKYSVKDAWRAICRDRRVLGLYSNSEGERHNELALTGSKNVGGFFDIANTFKMVEKMGDTTYFLAGGYYNFYESDFPITVLYEDYIHADVSKDVSVGWLVMDV